MLQVPKNVMQIGEINPHSKIYMEDYVHTFLERRKKNEVFLVFGKKEERDKVCFYMIYGAEKKTDWDRGSLPYFKNYERIGTIEGPWNKRIFKPVRGQSVILDGYFVFYEQNEDMQSYMIAVRESEDAQGTEEKEEVLEAVRSHKEQHRKELENAQNLSASQRAAEKADKTDKSEKTDSVLKKRSLMAGASLRRKAERNAAGGMRRKVRTRPVTVNRAAGQGDKKRALSFPDFCRAASFVLLLLLVVLGLTSINRYPDMKAIGELFGNAAKAVSGKEKDQAVSASVQDDGILVEEALPDVLENQTIPEAVMNETQDAADGMLPDSGLAAMKDDGEQIQWTIGQTPKKEEQPEEPEREQEKKQKPVESTQQSTDTAKAEETAADTSGQENKEEKAKEEAKSTQEQPAEEKTESTEAMTQAIARPVTYVVKKGDSLAEISRKFYGTASMVREICSANEIKDPDQIRPGQNILLP